MTIGFLILVGVVVGLAALAWWLGDDDLLIRRK
jgi:hypothetical protein